MSEKREMLGSDGEVIGEEIHFDDRRPTRKSSGAHLDPDASDGRRRLDVRCGTHVLLTALGATEPLKLLGRFAPDHLLLHGAAVVADRPDLDLAHRRTYHGQRPPTVVADSARPLQLFCFDHPQGHDVDPARLRAEITAASQKSSRKATSASCQVGRVATQD